MSVTLASWQRLWTALGAHTIDGGVFNQLVAAYSEPQRRYHTLQHLRECLAHFEAASALAQRPDEVELALWFHDAVYDPRGADNEERSAAWALAAMLRAGCARDAAERVQALVLATRHMAQPAAPAPDTDLLLDVDLAILGAAPARFAESDRQIRAEYAHVPLPEFLAGRAQVMAAFLARPRLYRTEAFHQALEKQARANLSDALRQLQAAIQASNAASTRAT